MDIWKSGKGEWGGGYTGEENRGRGIYIGKVKGGVECRGKSKVVKDGKLINFSSFWYALVARPE